MTAEATRREVIRKGSMAVVLGSGLSSVVDVAAADTSSGSVELMTTATIPTNTSISITVYESTDGDSSADRQQTKTISDGTTTTVFDLLESSTAQGDLLWMEVSLSTTDSSVTPSLDSATITLPSTPDEPATTTKEPIKEPNEPQGLVALWNNYRAFVALVVIAYAGIGLWSRSLTLAAWSGYIAFLYIAFTTGTALFTSIGYVTLILVFIGFAFKLVRLEFEGEG